MTEGLFLERRQVDGKNDEGVADCEIELFDWNWCEAA